MEVKEEIQNEVDNIKSKLSMAQDNGDKYMYYTLTDREFPFTWSEQQINEILRGLNRVDGRLISHSEIAFKQYKNITFLFEIIYN